MEAMQAQKNYPVERRKQPPHQSVWWARLSLAQKFSVSSLGKFGYELQFVRNEAGHSLAVLLCNGAMAVVKEDGDIDTSNTLKIR